MKWSPFLISLASLDSFPPGEAMGAAAPVRSFTIYPAKALPGAAQESRIMYQPGAPLSAGTARQITIFRFGDENHKNRKPSLIFHRLGFLLALFRMTGLDYRGFGVHGLPGGGLFFVLFHETHLAYSLSEGGENMRFRRRKRFDGRFLPPGPGGRERRDSPAPLLPGRP